MPFDLINRNDLIAAFNQCRFQLRHYTVGIYPCQEPKPRAMPVNRIFFPLENPNGADNAIADQWARHTLAPGHCYFVPAYLPVQFALDEKLRFLSLHTSLHIFPGVELFSHCPRVLALPPPHPGGELLALFHSSSEAPFLNAVKAGALAFALMADLLPHYAPEDFRQPLALRQYLPLAEYLDRHGSAATTVGDLAARCGESREVFTRHFKARTGITPKQLIDRFVIDRCARLLEEGLSSKEITARLQFSSEFVFSRYFKRQMKLAPRAWRNRNALHAGV